MSYIISGPKIHQEKAILMETMAQIFYGEQAILQLWLTDLRHYFTDVRLDFRGLALSWSPICLLVFPDK